MRIAQSKLTHFSPRQPHVSPRHEVAQSHRPQRQNRVTAGSLAGQYWVIHGSKLGHFRVIRGSVPGPFFRPARYPTFTNYC
jgi:hypothetical protein